MKTPNSPEPASAPLGVLNPDNARAILVISEDGDLSVALREHVDRAYALVRDLRPAEASAGIAASLPWPWIIVGNTERAPAVVVATTRTRPVLVFWQGVPPADLPRHTQNFHRFVDLVGMVEAATHQEVAGMRLSVGLGVDLPGGTYARSAELQALVSAYPNAFDVSPTAFRSAARLLASHNISLRPIRHADTGMVGLAPSQDPVPA